MKLGFGNCEPNDDSTALLSDAYAKTDMKHLFMAIIASVFSVFVVTFAVAALDSIGTHYKDIWFVSLTAGVAAFVAFIIVIVWALPVHFVLKKFNRQSLGWYLLAAVIPSIVFIYAFKPFGQDSNIDLMTQTLFCSFCGVLAAGLFWYIAVYRQRITGRSSEDALTSPSLCANSKKDVNGE